MPSAVNRKKPFFRMPAAPGTIEKGSTLKDLLDAEAIDCLAHNLAQVIPRFKKSAFIKDCEYGLADLGIVERGQHLAKVMRRYLPSKYADAIPILLETLGPPLAETEGNGLAPFFYLPHVSFVALYGWDATHNDGEDPFQISMSAQHALTRRFSAEFSMRPFLIHHEKRTLKQLHAWTQDPDPHVRRLCSEGSRPRLPWAMHIPSLIRDPRPALPLLEALKDDAHLYVRRSVANHLGDIAKDHPALVFELLGKWVKGASPERKWLIRHAVRHPAKQGVKEALRLRALAK